MSGFFSRLRAGLTRSSRALGDGISAAFGGGKLSLERLGELEDVLISADLGVSVANEICQALRDNRELKNLDDTGLREALAVEIAKQLQPVQQNLRLPTTAKPAVILMAGVNGAGKTTTIGKLAKRYMAEGKTVMLAACDTFRAAASEQLQVWGERANVPVVAGAPGADASGLAFQALERAKAENIDILIVDTAGRLQSNETLMAELEKNHPRDWQARCFSAARQPIDIRRHHWTKCHSTSRSIFARRQDNRFNYDQARRHGPWRLFGADCPQAGAASAFYRRW